MNDFFEITGEKLECNLCPHLCKLSKGKTGICGVRKNTGNKIELTTYGVISGYALDPVEKKPLYHFFPGYKILSVGSYGCNMRCDFCQNYDISQSVPSDLSKMMTASQIVRNAHSYENNIGIAFTYNEPVISYEFMRDVALEAKKENLHTVMVSNGYVNSLPLKEIISFIDAFNIDLKAFNDETYKKLTGALLGPVLDTLKEIAKSGKHLEITTLLIPGVNDDENEMRLQAKWIADELGPAIPLHLSRYFPRYKRNNPPTPEESVSWLADIASESLSYVYGGNTVSDCYQDTVCTSCGTTVTERSGYTVRLMNLGKNGECTKCGNRIYENFTLKNQRLR